MIIKFKINQTNENKCARNWDLDQLASSMVLILITEPIFS